MAKTAAAARRGLIAAPPSGVMGVGQRMADRSFELRTTDVDRIREAVEGLFCPFELTVWPRRYDGRLRNDPLGPLSFTTLSYGERVAIDVDDRQPRFLLQVPLTGGFDARTTGAEQHVAPLHAQVVRPGAPLHMRCAADCTILIVSADAREAQAQARALAGSDIDFPGTLPEVVPLCGAGASLGRYIDFLRAEAQQPDSALARGHGARPAAQALLALLLESAGVHGQKAPASRPFYVKRAEAFMEANLTSAIGIADVTASAGVSVRTLHHGFRACHGIAPMAWLRRRRLELVRDELLAADPATTSVTEVALRCGVTHLGRFALDYRARFGELPSQTLRRERRARS